MSDCVVNVKQSTSTANILGNWSYLKSMSKRGSWGQICSKLRLLLHKEQKGVLEEFEKPSKASSNIVAQSKRSFSTLI